MLKVHVPIFRRPFQFAVVLFLGMVLFVFAVTPFLPDKSKAYSLNFAVLTVAFCALSAFGGGGIGLGLFVRSTWVCRWMSFFLVGLTIESLFVGLFLVLCALGSSGRLEPNETLTMIDWVILPLYWINLALIAFLCLIGARGWIDYFRWRRSHEKSTI